MNFCIIFDPLRHRTLIEIIGCVTDVLELYMLKMSAAVNDIKAESFSKASNGLFML